MAFAMERYRRAMRVDRYVRVLKMARKPNRREFLRASAIAAVGILVLGAIGFLISLLMLPLPQS